MTSYRRERVAEAIREAIAGILATEVKDPRVGFVTVTRVELTSDLEMARVFVGVLADEAGRKETMKALGKAVGFVRRALGRRVQMRLLPDLVFEYDKGLDAAERVARLLEDDQRRGED